MAVVNQYQFFGVTGQDLSGGKIMFGTSSGVQLPLISETYIIKSLRVVSTGTPIITVTDNGITVIKKVVVAGVSQELLTQPLIVVGATTLVITASTASATDVGISFLNIKKSTVD
tara:strand:+ start:344 stop:688 length:345 start_codon:yes stop_codon:yes gene_type:complete